MKIIKPTLFTIDEICKALSSGKIIISPTDTVYGFLADAGNKKAVAKIYKIKKREKLKPLPVFVASIAMAKEVALIDKKQEKILKKYWPGKYTFILKRKPYKLFGVDKKDIALRIPKHPFLKKVLKKIGRPLVQTSVNISGLKPLESPGEIKEFFGKHTLIDLLVDGKIIKKSKPSRIIDLRDNHKNIIRK